MKTFAMFKTLPFLGLAVYGVMRGVTASRPKKAKQVGSDLQKHTQNTAIQGTVTRVLHDSSYHYALLKDNGQNLWIAIKASEADTGYVVGQQVFGHVSGTRDAHESKELEVAFERIHFLSLFQGPSF